MAAIDGEIQALKDNLGDMLELVQNQLIRCKKVLTKNDTSLAGEVVADEKKVNNQELAIGRDCENILALHTPVATDLRFVISALMIARELERVGDTASKLAKFLLKTQDSTRSKWLKKFGLEAMLDTLADMLGDMGKALKNEDAGIALKAIKKDKLLNTHLKKAFKATSLMIADYPAVSKGILTLFIITRDLERAGDRTKNIAEEIVFHLEARVLKHSKI